MIVVMNEIGSNQPAATGLSFWKPIRVAPDGSKDALAEHYRRVAAQHCKCELDELESAWCGPRGPFDTVCSFLEISLGDELVTRLKIYEEVPELVEPETMPQTTKAEMG